MSGSVQNTYPFPINLSLSPREGGKAVSVYINWNDGAPNPTYVNLLAQFNTGQFTSVQSVWVDNSTNMFPIFISCQQEQQTLFIPAFTQGLYPLVVGAAPLFEVLQQTYVYSFGDSQNPPLGSTTLIFFNTHQYPYQLNQPPLQQDWASSMITATALATPYQVLAAPPAPLYYAMVQMQINIYTTSATFPAGGIFGFLLLESGASTGFFHDVAEVATGASGVIYSKLVSFQQNVLLPMGTAIEVQLSGIALPTGGVIVNIQLYYSFAIIE